MENPVSTSTTTEDAPAPLRTTHPPEERLGTLSFHLDGAICRVNCEYCYLGARPGPRGGARSLDAALMEELIATLPYKEVAVSLSEPAEMWAHGLKAVIRAARNRGKPVAVTTTLAVARNHIGMLSEATRINLSVDPAKGPVNVRVIADSVTSELAKRQSMTNQCLTTGCWDYTSDGKVELIGKACDDVRAARSIQVKVETGCTTRVL